MTGVFSTSGEDLLDSAGIEAGNELVVRREISREGRNRVFVNDQPVTLGLLTRLAPDLLRIHGQREELSLVRQDPQRSWLDQSGGAEGVVLLESVSSSYRSFREADRRLSRLRELGRERAHRLDLLRYQVTEIDAAALVSGEEVSLREERDVLRHAETILSALAMGWELLSDDEGSAEDRLARCSVALDGIAAWESRAAGWSAEMEELRIRLSEVGLALRRRMDSIEADPGRLGDVEDRLAALERLFRKYGESSAEVLEYRDRIEAELHELEGDEAGEDELQRVRDQRLAEYEARATELSRERRRWAGHLEKGVERELSELALAKSQFRVQVTHRHRQDGPLDVDGTSVAPSEWGIDDVTFLFSPNPGEEIRPLAKVASGGELARLYLALQVAARGGGEGSPITLVFDEVDAGVGGAQAAALGQKLKRLAQDGQVLVVTHLPQVASFAGRHYRVNKKVMKGRTRVAVERLSGEERVEELARMLAGSRVTGSSRSHARELLESAGGTIP